MSFYFKEGRNQAKNTRSKRISRLSNKAKLKSPILIMWFMLVTLTTWQKKKLQTQWVLLRAWVMWPPLWISLNSSIVQSCMYQVIMMHRAWWVINHLKSIRSYLTEVWISIIELLNWTKASISQELEGHVLPIKFYLTYQWNKSGGQFHGRMKRICTRTWKQWSIRSRMN